MAVSAFAIWAAPKGLPMLAQGVVMSMLLWLVQRVATDIVTSNGVIHVIDSVILPD